MGSKYTFIEGNKKSIIDLTLASSRIATRINDWKVSDDIVYSDHMAILFDITSDFDLQSSKRIKRKTDWIKYYRTIKDLLSHVDLKQIQTTDELELAAENFKNILLDSYYFCFKEKVVVNRFHNSWFAPSIKQEREKLRKAFRAVLPAYRRSEQEGNEKKRTFKSIRANYRKTATDARRNAWKVKVGAILKDDGTYTNSNTEAAKLLMKTHFPDCVEIDEVDSPHSPSFFCL